MIVYISVFVITMILCSVDSKGVVSADALSGHRFNRLHFALMLLPLFLIVVFRTDVGDTRSYINTFNELTTDFTLEGVDQRAVVFFSVMRVCKSFLFQNSQMWLALIATACVIPFAVTLKRYSVNIRMSMFVFFASTEFIYLLSGARQFLAVCIMFYAMRFIVERRPIAYFLALLLASSIHYSILIMLPGYFVANLKPWDFKMLLVIAAVFVATIFSDQFFGIMSEGLLENSAYASYIERIERQAGVNVIRFIVAAVPPVLSLIYRRDIERLNDPVINISITMSLMHALVLLYATTMGGDLTGRIAESFMIYNLLAYPFLFEKVITKARGGLLRIFFYVGYVGFFYYQMYVAWGGLPYVSDILNIYC